MKNKFKLFACLGIASIIGSVLCGVSLSMKKSNASISTNTDYSDQFSTYNFSDKWIANGDAKMSYEHDGIIFNCIDDDAFAGSLNFRDYKITKDCRLEISFIFEELTDSSILGLTLGNQTTATSFAFAGLGFTFGSGFTHIFKSSAGILEPVESLVQSFSPISPMYGSSEMKAVFDFKECEDDQYFVITYSVYTSNDELIGTFTYPETYIQEGYIGFITDYMICDLTAFKIFEGDEKVIDTDFQKSNIRYLSGGSGDCNWVVSGFYDETTVKIGPIGCADLTKVDSELVYFERQKLDIYNELETLYTLSFDLDVYSLSMGISSGVEFGKAFKNSKGTFVGVSKDINGYFLNTYFDIRETRKPISVSNPRQLSLKVTVYYDNSFTVSVSNQLFRFECLQADGYFSLVTRDHFHLGKADSLGAKFDNFSFVKSTYEPIINEDASINFEGVKETIDYGMSYYSYYVSNKEWYMSNDVKTPLYRSDVKNNHLLMSNYPGVLNTCFGSTKIYSDFILRFDVTFYNEPVVGQTIAMEFGKPIFDMSYATTKSIGVQYNADEQFSYVYSTNCLNKNGNNIEYTYKNRFPVASEMDNIFLEGNTVTFMYVVENGNIKLFYKNIEDDDSILQICRAEYENLDTTGYIGICAYNGLACELDNVSITNLDFNYTSSLYRETQHFETSRFDFSKGDQLLGFESTGASINDNKLLIEGRISSIKDIAGHIVRFTTKDVGGSFLIKHGNYEISVSKDGRKITLIRNLKIREIDLDSPINLENTIFEVFAIGDTLTFSYVDASKPKISIRNNSYTFKVEDTAAAPLEIVAIDGAMSLTNLSVFNLDTNVSIETRNYDPEKDAFNPWPVRPAA